MNVLVVDDDSMTRLILKQVLQGHLHATVVEATNGFDALVALDTSPFDLVILDLEMPVMDGLTVLRTMRATKRLAELPVVVLSASRKDDNVVGTIKLGVSDYLTKPFRGKEVAERLAQAIAAAPRHSASPAPAES